MKDYVKGIYKQTIFRSEKGYIIGLLKVFESNIIEMQELKEMVKELWHILRSSPLK